MVSFKSDQMGGKEILRDGAGNRARRTQLASGQFGTLRSRAYDLPELNPLIRVRWRKELDGVGVGGKIQKGRSSVYAAIPRVADITHWYRTGAGIHRADGRFEKIGESISLVRQDRRAKNCIARISSFVDFR